MIKSCDAKLRVARLATDAKKARQREEGQQKRGDVLARARARGEGKWQQGRGGTRAESGGARAKGPGGRGIFVLYSRQHSLREARGKRESRVFA